MRKTILLGALLLALLPLANGQIPANTLMIGGNSGLGIHANGFNLGINPRVGFFVAPDLALGADVNTFTSLYVGQNSTDWNFDYDLGMFLRYYLAPGKKWRPFLHAEMSNVPTIWRFDAALGGGLAYFISPKVSIETQVLFQVFDMFGNRAISVTGLNVGFHVFILPKTKE